jgi:hypothetical protein
LLKRAGTRAVEALGTKDPMLENFKTIAEAVAILAENSLMTDRLINLLAACSSKALALAKAILNHPQDKYIIGLYYAPAVARDKYLANVLTEQDRQGLFDRIRRNRSHFEALIGTDGYHALFSMFDNNDNDKDFDFSARFKQRYRQICRCPWLGNIWRSPIGKKVFSDNVITENEVKEYVERCNDGATAMVLRSSL